MFAIFGFFHHNSKNPSRNWLGNVRILNWSSKHTDLWWIQLVNASNQPQSSYTKQIQSTYNKQIAMAAKANSVDVLRAIFSKVAWRNLSDELNYCDVIDTLLFIYSYLIDFHQCAKWHFEFKLLIKSSWSINFTFLLPIFNRLIYSIYHLVQFYFECVFLSICRITIESDEVNFQRFLAKWNMQHDWTSCSSHSCLNYFQFFWDFFGLFCVCVGSISKCTLVMVNKF